MTLSSNKMCTRKKTDPRGPPACLQNRQLSLPRHRSFFSLSRWIFRPFVTTLPRGRSSVKTIRGQSVVNRSGAVVQGRKKIKIKSIHWILKGLYIAMACRPVCGGHNIYTLNFYFFFHRVIFCFLLSNNSLTILFLKDLLRVMFQRVISLLWQRHKHKKRLTNLL